MTSKPQKRLGNYIQRDHPEIDSKRRRELVKSAKVVSRQYVPWIKGQRKLNFSIPSSPSLSLPPPPPPLHPNSSQCFPKKVDRHLGDSEAKVGRMTHFGKFTGTEGDFHKFLMSLHGLYKSKKSANAILADVSKLLFYFKPDWDILLNKVGSAQTLEIGTIR